MSSSGFTFFNLLAGAEFFLEAKTFLFLLAGAEEPSYNQNYDDNYYPYDSPSFPCCDNCGGSHETFQCQQINQNVDFPGFDQIQTLQYPDVHPPSQEKSDEVFQAKGDLMKSIQTFLEEFNCIPFEEKPQILLEAWFKFFTIQHAQPEDSNRLFQKLLKDLKELAEYKESLENSSNEIATSSSNQEEDPPQDSDIRQLIREECYVEVSEEQKLKMEDTILELVKICCQKELYFMYDNVNDLIESALNSKLLSINSNSQHTSQISPVHAVAPILSTEEPAHSLSMGYDHLSITPETESDEVTESNAKNLLPIPSECEVTSDDESDNDESLPDEDVPAEEFKVYSNSLFDEDEMNSDKLDPYCFNVESNFVEYFLNRDTFIDSSSKFDFSGELAHVNPEITESDFDFEEEIHLSKNLLYDNSSSQPPEEHNADEERIKREHAEYICRMEMLFTINPCPRPTVNVDTIVESLSSLPIPVQDINSQREEIDIVTETDDVLPLSVESDDDSEGEIDDDPSFPRPPLEPPDAEFDFVPDSEEEIPVVMNEKDEFDDDYFPFVFVPYLICT
nr:hypothetical protein [Tanacetum cinerariifolium]